MGSQQRRRAEARWNMTAGYQPAELRAPKRETNEEATLRMISTRLRGSPALVPSEERKVNVPRNFKRDLCIFHSQGKCDKGTNCTYAHGKEELRSGADSTGRRAADDLNVHFGPSWESGP